MCIHFQKNDKKKTFLSNFWKIHAIYICTLEKSSTNNKMMNLHNTYSQIVLISDNFIGIETACVYGKQPF